MPKFHTSLSALAAWSAATVLLAVSAYGNLRFGLSLAQSPSDKLAYASASVGIDVFKATLPLFAFSLWSFGHRFFAMVGILLWFGCFAWSFSAAVGFSLATRAEATAERVIEKADQTGWTTTIKRAQSQVAALGDARPTGVIEADLTAARVPEQIWTRTRRCTDATILESQTACAAVVHLRRELAVARESERLEQTMAEGRAAASRFSGIDPQVVALARLTGVDDAGVRTMFALLLAGILEAASSVGFTILALATKYRPANIRSRDRADLAEPQRWSKGHSRREAPQKDAMSVQFLTVIEGAKNANLQRDVALFLGDRTSSVEGGVIGSTVLFEAFRTYCRTRGLTERSQQALGKELTRLGMPKARCTRSGRVEYTGLVLKDQQRPSIGSGQPTSSGNPSPLKVQPTAAQVKNRRNGAACRKVLEGLLVLPSNSPSPA